MKKTNKVLILAIMLALLVSICVIFTACDKDKDGDVKIPITSDFVIDRTVHGITLLEVTQIGCEKSKLTIPDGVECIATDAFLSSAFSLVEITIPDSVTRLSDGAFEACINLEKVNFGTNSNLKYIGSKAFNGCIALTKLTLPSKVEVVGNGVFQNTQSLCVTIAADAPFVGASGLGGARGIFVNDDKIDDFKEEWPLLKEKIFKKSQLSGDLILDGTKLIAYIGSATHVELGSNITEIGDNAFYGNKLLYSVKTNCEIIGNDAFRDCTLLTKFDFGTNLKSIGKWAFSYCRIDNIVLPSGTLSIGDYAFNNCTQSKNITIPLSVTWIGYYAFDSWQAIQTITVIGRTSAPSGWHAFSAYSCYATINWLG